ncbi:MAG: hypothetical protein EPO28_17760 [Saprospiraceae bacterium]|nr:MAG: hypothetical protein EPO28_17760 [Saprospiraceae bacterium]
MKLWRKFWKNTDKELSVNYSPAPISQLLARLLRLYLIPLTLVLIPHSFSSACIPYDFGFRGYTFVNMNILKEGDRTTLAPLFMRFDKMYHDFFEAVGQVNQNENLAEWSERFCGFVKEEDLAYLIYKAPIEDLDLLRTAAQSKSLPVPSRMQDNDFAQYLWRNKCLETIDYLIFAKSCEPHVVTHDSWQSLPKDVAAMQRLIAEGRKKFKRTRSHYMRLRYAYQIIRLAHYAGQYEQTLKLYDELMPQVDKQHSRWAESIIPWWILGHKAGALRKLGHHVEASYDYALIFKNCTGRRASAYQSFLIKTDAEWADCLRLCQSDAERATLYVIRAADENSKAVDDMREIYRIDPTNENLEVLLVQEVRKMERNLLGLNFNDNKAHNKRYLHLPQPGVGEYIIELQKFVRQCRNEGVVARPQLWHIAEGYLEFLAGDNYAAGKTLHEAGAEVKDDLLKEQLAIFGLVLKVAELSKPDAATEEFVADIIKKNKLYKEYGSFPDYLKDRMAALYKENQQEGMAFLCQHPLSELRLNPQIILLDDILAMALKEDKTAFERLITQKTTANDILDMKATLLMSQGQLEAALETFRSIPAANWDDYGQFDPFRETFRDCIRCYQRPDTSVITAMNKGELLQELLDLEYKAKSGMEGAARHYYKLGLAFYNMSYFGYEWRAMDYFRSGSTWAYLNKGKEGVYYHFPYAEGNRENTNLSTALYNFEKARLLAPSGSELAAKATFHAARCEQKMYFVSDKYKLAPCCNHIPRLPETYLTNFSRLKQQYSGTEFYRQIIGECKYFGVYARR